MKAYLQYLVILLDDVSAAYCHASNPLSRPNLMPLDTLRKAILFGMKENLMIQFVYPDYELPPEYEELVESIDHVKIGRDIQIYNDTVPTLLVSDTIVLRISIPFFISSHKEIAGLLPRVKRMTVSFTDIESYKDELNDDFSNSLSYINTTLIDLLPEGIHSQINLLTDRLKLTEMHNCGAGIGNITIAPNGKFYLCPAFYYDERMGISNMMNHITKDTSRSVGDIDNGLHIPNKHLLRLENAPLCRTCDAYHCNRCIWLNQKLTWDSNTPSHQQCVLSHLERNATMDLSRQLISKGYDVQEIGEIAYLDPFDVHNDWG